MGTTAVWCANAGTTAMPGTTPVSQRAPILSNVERHGSDAVRVVCIYVQRRRGPAGQLGMMKDDMTGKRLRRGNIFWQFRQIMFFSELVVWQLEKITVGY